MSINRVLTVPRNLDSLAFPLKSSIGLKYSSVALSSSLICLGTNTGSTYVFEKDSLKLVKFIASKGGSIEILHFSKDERLLAIADSTGIVTCLEANERKYELKVVREIEDHRGARITALTWDDDSARLFIGDDRGIVTAVIVAPFKLPAGKFLSKSTIEVVVKGESPIVQLGFSQLKLLVSTTARTLLCFTDRSKYQQIGSKPRDGKFGSCFLQYGGGEYPVIYAARPGSRLWEVDFNGQVLATHQLKYLLATAPTALRGYRKARSTDNDHAWNKPQSIAFPRLLPLCNRFLVTWSSFALYIIDASFGKVAGWYDEIKGIKDISCRNETIFIVNDDGEVFEFEFMSVKACLKCLIGLPEYRQAAEVAVQCRDELLNSVESFLTIDFEAVQDVLSESDELSTKELVASLHDLIEKLQLRHNQIRSEVQERLNSLPSLDESSTPCDSGVEDNDDVRSNQSEVISETSSRLSLSRLPHVDVDRVLRKATNAVFGKIASSGFMKKALKNVKDETRQRPASPQLRNQLQGPRASISVDSSLPDEIELNQVANASAASSASTLPQFDGIGEQSKKMGNVEQKQSDTVKDGEIAFGGIAQAKQPVNGKRRRKAKIVTVEFESREKDDIFKTTSYDAPQHSHIRRLLSADSASSYSQISDTTRKGSLPQHMIKADSSQDSQLVTASDSTDAHSDTHYQPNIIEKARLLVRKVIHTEVPTPLDVRSAKDFSTRDFVTVPGKLACLLVSEDAMKLIPKFVDTTAVCRNKLRDSRVLFNSKTVKKILQDWAEKLAETVKGFSIAMADGIEKRNSKHAYTNEEGELLLMRSMEEFFSNLGAAFSEISNLAVLCFEAGIFPASCSDLTFLEKQLIENDITFCRIRKEVTAVLNKDDIRDANNEDGSPHGSPPSTMFFMAQNNDQCESQGNVLEGKDSIPNSVNERKSSFDFKAEQDERTAEEPLKRGDEQGSEPNYDIAVSFGIREGALEKVGMESDPSTVDSNESKASYANESVRTLHGMNIASQTDIEALRLGQSPKAADSSCALRSSHTTASMKSSGSAKVDEPLASSSEDNTPLNSWSSSIPSSPLRDYVNVPEPRRTCYLQDDIEVILCASDDPKTCKNCRKDACRACFVLRYFPLLDLSKIRTVLGWKQGCRWRTWLAYLIHLEDTTCSEELQQAIENKKEGKVSRLLYNSSNVELLFSCVRRLLPSSFSLVFDLCAEKDVQPWEVCFIYMIDASEHELLSKFLDYMTAVRNFKPSVNPLEDTSVAMTVLYCSLKFTSNSSNIGRYYCKCGAAREGAHLLPWTQQTFIDDVISVFVSKDPYRGLVDRAFDLCRRYGYWLGCIRILRMRQEHKQAFELISQLGEFDLVNQYFDTESFTITESDMKHLCNLTYHAKDDGTRCEPAIPGFIPTITSESLARLLVRELGPIQALTILKSSEQYISDLSNELYFDCMRVAEKEQQQRQIVHKMMEALSSEACIENKSMFQREIEVSKNREISNGFDKHSSKSKEDPTYEDKPNSTTLNHWGLSLSLASSICPCCSFLLCLHGASSSAGIVVFDCGHAYHRHCLPEESCLVCYYKLDPHDLSLP